MTKLEIKQAIAELEPEELTLSNARNLASLYILYNNVEKSNTEQSDKSESISDRTVIELKDIFPAYMKYRETKTKYQRHEISDDALVPCMRLVAQEIKEFVYTLYTNTYLRKERKILEDMLAELTVQISC